jgi:hypothetical protein
LSRANRLCAQHGYQCKTDNTNQTQSKSVAVTAG